MRRYNPVWMLCCLGIGCVLWGMAPNARAESILLRQRPSEGRMLSAAAGLPQLAFAFWPKQKLGVSVAFEIPGLVLSAVSFNVGTSFRLAGKERGWCASSFLSAGLIVPTLTPGAAFSFTPSFLGGYEGLYWFVRAGPVLSLAAQLVGRVQLRLTPSLELWLGGKVGRSRFGLQAQAGGALIPGLDFSAVLAAHLFWSMSF